MKTYKKLLVGAVSLLVMGLLFMVAPKHAAAAGTAPLADLNSCNSTFQWQDYAHIVCTLSDKTTTVTFTKSNPDQADDHNHYIFTPPSPDPFCGEDKSATDNYSFTQEGLIVQPDHNWTVQYFNEGYFARGVSGCQSFIDKSGKNPDVAPIKASAHIIPRSPNRSAVVLAGTADGAQSLPDVTDGKFAGYNFVRWKSEYDTTVSGTKYYLFAQNISVNQLGSDCTGDILAVATDKNDTSAYAYEFTLGSDASGYDWGKYQSLKNLNKNLEHPKCYVDSVNFGDGYLTNPTERIYISPAIQNVSKIGTGDVTQGGPKPKTPPDSTSGNTCGGPSGALNWIMCPLLLAAQDGANFLLDGFESLLSFNVNQDLGNQNNQASVKKTWSLVRNLATAFLVIIMLIMVFSQAISAGPFDAYTVRKMLPRLIAVAIAIQLSWAIVAWVIGIFDDLGKGIADIMYYPFGGADNLDLQSLLANAGVSSGAAAGISWVGIVGLLGIGLAALPAVLLLVLAAAAALFTAYFTLVMRKIIIIVLLIFAPIAMLAYVLPNTQKYWKMWYDNLIKILFMFPLIVIMISAGRIFAYIAGGQGGNHTGGALNFVLVMVAFFGPLFLLPKTYKWGGQAMSIASGAVGGIASRYTGRESALGKGVQGYGERWQGEKAKQYDPTANGYQRFKRRLQSGHVLPTQRSRRLAIASGDKWANERNEEANALVTRTQEKAMAGYDVSVMDENGMMVKKRMTGVEAGKQALVDLSGLEGGVANERAAQAAQKKLLETSSEIEMQSAVIQGGPNAGKRVAETTSFRKNIASSPEHYSIVNKGRYDFAPDLMDSAENDTGLKYETATGEDKKRLDRRRLEIAIDRMTPENMQNTHYGFYQDVAAAGSPELSRMLAAKIHDFAQNGGTIGSSAAGSLRGGRQKYVDQALAVAGPNIDLATITPRGATTPPPP